MTATLLDRVSAWAVPASALRLARLPEAVVDVLELLERNVVVVPSEPVAFDDDMNIVPVPENPTDDELDALLIIEPDVPTLEEVAVMAVSAVNAPWNRYPGPLSWRRWRSMNALTMAGYRLGVLRSTGYCWAGGDPVGGGYISGRLKLGRSSYLLGMPSWWWRCQRDQGRRLRGRHRPLSPFYFGICAACAPCQDCGAPYECAATCEGDCCAR